MFTLINAKCSERKASFRYSIGGQVICGCRSLPMALSITRSQHCSDVHILILCKSQNEQETVQKLASFAHVRRATVYSIRPKKRNRQPMVKIGVLFPMDERHRTFRQYLAIAEYAIDGIDQALNAHDGITNPPVHGN